MKAIFLIVWLLGFFSLSLSARETKFLHRDVLVFIPAYEGAQLFDPDLSEDKNDSPRCVWGCPDIYFSRTLYFSLRMPNQLIPKPLLGVGPLDVYRGMVERLTQPGDQPASFTTYTEGSDFFIFAYDWRQEIASVTAPELDRALAGYARIHAEKTGIPSEKTRFIIVTHSMGGFVARTWLSENPEKAYQVAALYLVGSPNRGSIKAAGTLVFGPESIDSFATGFPGVLLNLVPTNVDQNVTKLVGITRPSLYELLPSDDPHWTDISPQGTKQTITAGNLLEAKTWELFWPSAELERHLFLDDWLKKREETGRKKIVRDDWSFCQDPSFGQLHHLLDQTTLWRKRQGSLQHTASLLSTQPGRSRLHIVVSTGLKTPAGMVTWGRNDSAKMGYTFENSGDGTVLVSSVLDGLQVTDPRVKVLDGVPHGRLMIDDQFLSYFVDQLASQQVVPTKRMEP